MIKYISIYVCSLFTAVFGAPYAFIGVRNYDGIYKHVTSGLTLPDNDFLWKTGFPTASRLPCVQLANSGGVEDIDCDAPLKPFFCERTIA